MAKTKKNKILVPVDFSEQSSIALGQSYNLARGIDASLTLLYVIEDRGALFKFFSKKQNDDIKKNIQKELDKLAADVEKKTKLKVETLIAKGAPYEKISGFKCIKDCKRIKSSGNYNTRQESSRWLRQYCTPSRFNERNKRESE